VALKIWIDVVTCEGSFQQAKDWPSVERPELVLIRVNCFNTSSGWLVLDHLGHPTSVELRDGWTATSRGAICPGCTMRYNAAEPGFHVKYVG